MTRVEFEFYDLAGAPLVGAEFTITLRKAGFVQGPDGVVTPSVTTAVTGPDGKVIVEIAPSSTPYYVVLPNPNSYAEDDCCESSLARYKMYVPDTTEVVRAQDLFIDVPPSTTTYDEAAILIIIDAKVAAVNAATQAAASAVKAEEWAQSIGDDAQSARDSAVSALASKNAAESAAINAVTAAEQAKTSSDSAHISETNAGQSATSASGSAGAALASQSGARTSELNAAASASAAGTSATNAGNSASTASALADQAAQARDKARLWATADEGVQVETGKYSSYAWAINSKYNAEQAAASAASALAQANLAKASADNAAASMANKQDKNAKLTSISGLVGVQSLFSVPLIAGNSDNFSLAQVSASPTDMTADRIPQVGHHGMGTGSAIAVGASGNADTLPLINGRFTFGNGGTNLPYPYVWIEQFCSGGNGSWVQQVAYALNDQGIWHRQFISGSNNNVAWIPVSVGPASTDAEKLAFRNNLGLGTPYTYSTNINAATPAQGLILGYSYVNPSTTGTKPYGSTYGVVNTIINSGDHMQQDYVVLNGISGVTQNLWRRSGYAGSWGSWYQVYDTQSALKPVNNTADSGLMDTTVYNGNQIVHRYANGAVEIYMPGANVDMGSNEIKSYPVNLPINLVDLRFASLNISYTPAISSDCYGCIYSYFESTNRVGFVLRNGATVQTFGGIFVAIRGRWK